MLIQFIIVVDIFASKRKNVMLRSWTQFRVSIYW